MQQQLAQPVGKAGVVATSKVENLYKLEKSLESLASPKWNTKLFGAIDAQKRDRGEKLFQDTCAGCHKEPYKHAPGETAGDDFVKETGGGKDIALWKVTTVPFQTVGTDPSFITVHGARMVDKPELTGFFDELLRRSIAAKIQQPVDSPNVAAVLEMQKAGQIAKGVRTADGKIAAIAMLAAVTSAIEATELPVIAKGRDLVSVKQEIEFFRGPAADLGLTNYRARPLNGIAFTAPFGHNGAWPTLRDVLETEQYRPASFPVRPRSFDPVRVGLDTTAAKPGEKLFMMDTSVKGNLRGGHEYGVDLSAEDKDALVEYLKSI